MIAKVLWACALIPKACPSVSQTHVLVPTRVVGLRAGMTKINMVAQKPQPTFDAFKTPAHALLISSPQTSCVPRRLEQWGHMPHSTLPHPYTPHKNPGYGAVGQHVGSPTTPMPFLRDIYRTFASPQQVCSRCAGLFDLLSTNCTCVVYVANYVFEHPTDVPAAL